MKKRIVGCLLVMWVGAIAPAAMALDFGVFGSLWHQKDGDDVPGVGILLLPETVPMEFRATWYERANGRVRANPIDIGLTLALTRKDALRVTAVGGGSLYLLDIRGASSDTQFGLYVGARFEFSTQNNITVFGEAMFRGVDLDDPNLNLSGPSIQIGILF
ncbi:MAG: hypothetical protein U1E27_13275 [Kiritimatiellia bacterium]|nr:hypothetical protein [Kiritimatiellia bacterium]